MFGGYEIGAPDDIPVFVYPGTGLCRLPFGHVLYLPMKQIGYIHLYSILVSDLVQTTPHRNINRGSSGSEPSFDRGRRQAHGPETGVSLPWGLSNQTRRVEVSVRLSVIDRSTY